MLSMNMVDTFDLRHQRPSSVKFSTEAKPVNGKVNEFGLPIYENIDYVTVRQVGSKDSTIFKVSTWFDHILPIEVEGGRLNPVFVDQYRKMYDLYKKGQDIPVEGTPIKMWPVATPAQVALLTSLNILTVEDLATLPDEGMRRIGMGAQDLKNKAMSWLMAANDKGRLTTEMSQLQAKNDLLEKNLATLTAQLDELKKHLIADKVNQTATVDISDAFDDEPTPKGKKK